MNNFYISDKIYFMRVKVFFTCLLLICFSLFSQEALLGVWQNGGRFIEFTANTGDSNLNMRIVLKPYYTYVYESLGNFTTQVSKVENFDGLNILQIQYPRMKRSVYLPICIIDNFLFTSFFQRQDFTSSEPELPAEAVPYGITKKQAKDALFYHESPLYGFWTEQGSRDGIMLHANDAPEYFDAYFFTDDEYFRFRYWKDDLAKTERNANFSDSKGITFSVPRILSRGTLQYACVTANATTLRNYESGSYTLHYAHDSYTITLTPLKAGPGSHASKDTYENAKYPEVINLPLSITADGKIFSYGDPFVIKTDITDLDAEIAQHNALKKEPPEPQLQIDQIDFYEERIRELEKLVPKTAGAADNAD